MIPLLILPQPTCTACDLHQYAKHPGVPGVFYSPSLTPSPSTPTLIILGMNPGYQEDRSNTPFVGPAGHLLKDVYLPPLLAHASIFLLNTARCYSPSSAPPKTRHFRTCFPLFSAKDIATLALPLLPSTPKILLCVGSHAISTVTRFTQPKPWSLATAFSKQGTPTNLWGDWQLFSTFHPAAVLRTRNLLHPVADHIALVQAALTGQMPVASSPRIVSPFSPERKVKQHEPNQS